MNKPQNIEAVLLQIKLNFKDNSGPQVIKENKKQNFPTITGIKLKDKMFQ